MTYRYPTGRTAQEVYDDLYANTDYGEIEHTLDTRALYEGCESILDVGAGISGFAAKAAAKYRMKRAVTCDISAVAVRRQETESVWADLSKSLPFADDEFDVVTCFATLEHIQPEAVDTAIRELGRVAKKRIILMIGYLPPHGDKQKSKEPLHLTLQTEPWWIRKIEALLPVRVTVFPLERGKHIVTFLIVDK